MTDDREAQLLAIIADQAATIRRLTSGSGAGGSWWGLGGGGGYRSDEYPGRGGGSDPNRGQGIGGVAHQGGGGSGERAQFTFATSVLTPRFPPHDPNFPDVNPATGDERETTEGEAA